MSDEVGQPGAATEDTPVDNTQPGAENANTEHDENADTFPRKVVEDLRHENANHRQRVKDAETRADELARRLHVELVRQTGRLSDPTDAEYDANHLTDPDGLSKALDALLEAKPHLKARKVTGDVGQGKRDTAETVDLAAMLRARA